MMGLSSTRSRALCSRLIATAFLSFMAGYANADRIVTTMGQRSCADWLAGVQEDSKVTILGPGSWRHIANRTWLAGYVSGLNMGLSTEKNHLEAIDFETVADWVGQYCERNKDKDLLDAGRVLFEKLGALRKPKKKPGKDVMPKVAKQKN
jgi:hypothetical protein